MRRDERTEKRGCKKCPGQPLATRCDPCLHLRMRSPRSLHQRAMPLAARGVPVGVVFWRSVDGSLGQDGLRLMFLGFGLLGLALALGAGWVACQGFRAANRMIAVDGRVTYAADSLVVKRGGSTRSVQVVVAIPGTIQQYTLDLQPSASPEIRALRPGHTLPVWVDPANPSPHGGSLFVPTIGDGNISWLPVSFVAVIGILGLLVGPFGIYSAVS